MGKLTAMQVKTLKEAGRHSDGGNLYLNISKSGAKSWVFFYRFAKAQREMGLGSVVTTSLAEARSKALAALKILHDGQDPLNEKRAAEKELKKKLLPTLPEVEGKNKPATLKPERKKLSFKEKHEFEKLEKEIVELEEEKSNLETQLSLGTLHSEKIHQLSKQLSELLHEIEKKTVRWMELSESI